MCLDSHLDSLSSTHSPIHLLILLYRSFDIVIQCVDLLHQLCPLVISFDRVGHHLAIDEPLYNISTHSLNVSTVCILLRRSFDVSTVCTCSINIRLWRHRYARLSVNVLTACWCCSNNWCCWSIWCSSFSICCVMLWRNVLSVLISTSWSDWCLHDPLIMIASQPQSGDHFSIMCTFVIEDSAIRSIIVWYLSLVEGVVVVLECVAIVHGSVARIVKIEC